VTPTDQVGFSTRAPCNCGAIGMVGGYALRCALENIESPCNVIGASARISHPTNEVVIETSPMLFTRGDTLSQDAVSFLWARNTGAGSDADLDG